jgi:hypothetical protein
MTIENSKRGIWIIGAADLEVDVGQIRFGGGS